MNITVICPTYRNPKYLDLFLKSATENRADIKNEITVIVDGFYEESHDILSKYQNINVLEFQQNQGMQTAINIGVMQANTEWIFVVNDDNVLPKWWDSRILEKLKLIEDAYEAYCWEPGKCSYATDKVVLTVNQVEPTGPGMFNFPVIDLGKTVEEFQYEKWLSIEWNMRQNKETYDGHIFPFIVKKKYYMAIGGLDTFYCSPQICDWDMFLKWELLGFDFKRIHHLHLYHFGSVVTRKNSEAAQFRQREAQATSQFMYKWGIQPYNKPGENSKIPSDGKFRGFEN